MEAFPSRPSVGHFCYAPVYKQYKYPEDIFQKYLPSAAYVSTQDLRNILNNRKIAATPQGQEYKEVAGRSIICSVVFITVLVWSCINEKFADPVIQRRAPNSICSDGWNVFTVRIIDVRTNTFVNKPWEIISFCTMVSGVAGLSPNNSTWILTGIIALIAFGYCTAGLIAASKKANAAEESALNENNAIDIIINKLSVTGPSPVEEALPRDIALAFPYLAAAELPLLTFSQLNAARKLHLPLFEERLQKGLYAKKQLSIWRLFKHIETATPAMQKKIVSQQKSQTIIGCDPQFFQKVIRHLKLLDEATCRLCVQILKERVLKPNVFQDILDTKSVIKGIAEGKTLQNLVRAWVKEGNSSTLEQDAEEASCAFMHTGKLAIASPDQAYASFKLCLEKQNAPMADWLESYLFNHLEHLAFHSNRSAILEEITAWKCFPLISKIDQFLAQSQMLAPFNSKEFESNYLFAKKYTLKLYSKALKDFYTTQLLCFKIEEDPSGVTAATLNAMSQCELLFEDDIETFSHILLSKLKSILLPAPHMLEQLAIEAHAIQNEWLLQAITELYSDLRFDTLDVVLVQ